jgi:hypothetical protein
MTMGNDVAVGSNELKVEANALRDNTLSCQRELSKQKNSDTYPYRPGEDNYPWKISKHSFS